MRSIWVVPFVMGWLACSSDDPGVSDTTQDAASNSLPSHEDASGASPGHDASNTGNPGQGGAGGTADAAVGTSDARNDARTNRQDSGSKTDSGGGTVRDAAVESQPTEPSSQACKDYCKCMSTNCASETFPGGCAGDCAAGTKWDLECRTAHCGLVPDEPNNGHCGHAMGDPDYCPDLR
jgi:hypothetical protein